MTELRDRLRRYLTRKEDVDIFESHLPYVTFNRQDGVDAHAIGREIIRRLDALPDLKWNHGWELYDQTLCAEMIKTGHLPATYEELLKEQYGERGLQQMVYEMFVGKPEQYDLQKRIGEVMRFLMMAGKVVVVGSAAAPEATSLHTPRHGIRVRLVASELYRETRIFEELKLSGDAARKHIRESDAGRSRMVHEFYGHAIDDASLYDVCFRTDDLQPPLIAEAVIGMLRMRAEELHRKPGPALPRP